MNTRTQLTQLSSMLALQDQMNTLVHPQWREQNFAWYRAIWTECAELLDHYGWKWWKKQHCDIEQVQLELIDIWHFGLSILLVTHADSNQIASDLAHQYQQSQTNEVEPKEFKDLLESFTVDVLQHQHFDATLFFPLMHSINLSMEQLFKSYVGKNMLNRFRQDHGYQSGTYHKLWQGREDNEHLVEILEQLDSGSANFVEQLYVAMQQRYPQD